MSAKTKIEVEVKQRYENATIGMPIPPWDKDDEVFGGQFQVRQDGVFLNGKLYFWEELKEVRIKIIH